MLALTLAWMLVVTLVLTLSGLISTLANKATNELEKQVSTKPLQHGMASRIECSNELVILALYVNATFGRCQYPGPTRMLHVCLQ